MRAQSTPCSEPGCERPAFARGVCNAHYQWRKKRGLVDALPRQRRPLGSGTIRRGYLLITVNGKQVPEHRVVMERVLGRSLLDSEVVHHINGVRTDNRPENLMVLANHAEHRLAHTTTLRNETHKECTRCHRVKPRAEFPSRRNHGRRDPHFSRCKTCYRESEDQARRAKGCKVYRRRAVTMLLAFLAIALVAQASPSALAQPTSERPDVVVILTDDMRTSDWKALAESRRLLSDGTLFENYVAPSALCCPERASLLTGRYSHNHGVRGIGGKRGGWRAFRPHQPDTVAVALQRAGYRTALIGKYLNGYPKRRRSSPAGWDFFNGYGSKMPYRARGRYLTDALARRAAGFVAEGAGPVLLWFAPHAPHNPAEPAGRHQDLFPEASGLDRKRLQTLAAVDEAVVAVAAALGPDRWAGACVLLLSDNGALLLGGGKVKKGTWHDEAVRVPALVRCPGLPGGSDDRLAASIDVTPTILHAAGVDAWWEIDGRPLQDGWARTGVLLEGWTEPGTKRDRTYAGVKTADGLYLELRKPRKRRALVGADGASRPVGADGAAWAGWLDEYRGCAGEGCRVADHRAPPT